jgi:DNA mismatch endonuclease (patch repair protein)
MSDIFSKKKRSEIMSKVGTKNTKPELFVRRLIHSMGFRYRLHRKDLPGKPDIVFQKYKKVIFVNGCFWHGHKNCKKAQLPKSNIDYWSFKINENKKRDRKNIENLNKLGWDNLIIWQCQLKEKNKIILKKRFLDFLN